jgi:uncharacterized Fe-S cluster-containing radical SAM superfamily enzyme
MADMEWVRKTHTDYIAGMKQHGDELENNNERHLYGAAINRINLLMEHIDELEARELGFIQSLNQWEAENQRLREALQEGKVINVNGIDYRLVRDGE